MTIPLNVPSWAHFAGTGVTANYPLNFPNFEDVTIEVYISRNFDGDPLNLQDIADEGPHIYPLFSGTDYVLNNVAKPNTEIVLLDASAVPPGWVGPIPARQEWLDSNGFLADGYSLYIEFITNAMRPAQLAHGNMLVPALTKDLDRLAMHIKAIHHRLERVVTYSERTMDTYLPLPPITGDTMLYKFADIYAKLQQLLDAMTNSAEVPTGGTKGDYLEYNAQGGLDVKSGIFQGYSQTLGRNVVTTGLTDAINQLFNWAVFPPTISLVSITFPNIAREKGTVIGPIDLRATAGKGTNNVLNVVFNGAGGATYPLASIGGSQDHTYPGTISSSTTFTATANDDQGLSATASITFNFYMRKFWGVVANTNPTEAQIEAMTNNALASSRGTISNIPAGNSGTFPCFAYPASLGLATGIIDAFSNNVISGYTRTSVNITNSLGVTEPYHVYTQNLAIGGSAMTLNLT